MRDRMGIIREDASDIPDYGSLYLRERGKIYGDTPTSINEYGASDDADIDLLPLLSLLAIHTSVTPAFASTFLK